ncbi:MAG: ABC transporter ATP-binding protein [Pyrodictiaceae archaeon]
MSEPILVLDDVWKRYRIGEWVLAGVSLRLTQGQVLLILGANGSGKTTLLRIAAGLTIPTRGSVSIAGRRPVDNEAKRRLGLVLDHTLLYMDLTVRENLEYYASIYGVKDNIEDHYAIEELGLKKYLDRKVKELSYGWRRRADFARALIHNPKLLLVDELFTGLDQNGIRAIVNIIDYLVEEEKAAALLVMPQKPNILPKNTKLFQLKEGRLHPLL